MLLHGFNPNFKSVSRNTMRKYCLIIYGDYKQKLISKLSNSSLKISLTSDIWTSQFKTNYLCVTAHYIDSNWVLQKHILSFFELEHRHTASIIASYITRALNEYGILNSIFSISLDNASANNNAVDILKRNLMPSFSGVFFHVHCACDILNLCVKDGLKIIEPHIEKIRNCILYVRNGSHRRHEFQTYCSERGRKCKKYLIDVDHRWNSTYEMLECAYDDRDIISMFCNDKFPEDQVTNYDWEASNLIKEFLEIFYTSTNMFSSVYHPTTSIIINQILFISEVFAPIVASMEVKFKKYFETIEPLPVLSMIFDPRFKIDGTFSMIDSCDKNMGLDHSFLKENYRSLFYDMYNEYHKKHGDRWAFNLPTTIESSSSNTKNRSATRVVNLINQIFFMGGSSSSSNTSTTSTSFYEINHYLNNNINNFLTLEEIDNFDILSWWKKQEHS
ncbi:Ribonuclease H-like protein [Dioscorea alata]|uniref:Ribonuclease H-like protein n=1 Tax=Dioscorea alata TaxID=55571 RepID=A0ACB7VWK8_DIOAL|nr:Ribonuclease H-like protein [Dioscorea alata]